MQPLGIKCYTRLFRCPFLLESHPVPTQSFSTTLFRLILHGLLLYVCMWSSRSSCVHRDCSRYRSYRNQNICSLVVLQPCITRAVYAYTIPLMGTAYTWWPRTLNMSVFYCAQQLCYHDCLTALVT